MGSNNIDRADNSANSGNVESERIEGASAPKANERGDTGTDATGSAGKSPARKSGGNSGGIGASSGGIGGKSGGNGTTSKAGGAANSTPVNPSELAGDTSAYQTDANGNVIYKADGTPAKKRGRKPGQTNSAEPIKAKPKNKADNRLATSVEMLAAQFQILNTGIAYLTSFEDFKLTDNESLQMANATANVMDQFDYVPDPKIAAVMGLVTTASMIYGPRIYLYNSDRKKKQKAKVTAKVKAADENAVAQTSGVFFNTNEFVVQ